MAKPKAKVVVVPFYDGTEDAAEVFTRIIREQIENELQKTEEQTNTNYSNEKSA